MWRGYYAYCLSGYGEVTCCGPDWHCHRQPHSGKTCLWIDCCQLKSLSPCGGEAVDGFFFCRCLHHPLWSLLSPSKLFNAVKGSNLGLALFVISDNNHYQGYEFLVRCFPSFSFLDLEMVSSKNFRTNLMNTFHQVIMNWLLLQATTWPSSSFFSSLR